MQRRSNICLDYINCIISFFLTFISFILVKSDKDIEKMQQKCKKYKKDTEKRHWGC